MSQNTKVTPTLKENLLKYDDLIVTKTDLKGNITYCNECFLNISALEEKEALNQPHSIIRHPDMPKAVFQLLWNTLKQGDEFFGIVKNLSTDGNHYWVFANITPSFDESGKTIGYFSVRRKANSALVKIMSNLYKKMLQAEVSQNNAQQAIEASTQILTDFIDEQGVSYNEYLISFT
ncbi:MAG: PAS domain-containing protein [Colwellia sp.]|nr:PAS domain-containing protein [Colwellia sp.]